MSLWSPNRKFGKKLDKVKTLIEDHVESDVEQFKAQDEKHEANVKRFDRQDRLLEEIAAHTRPEVLLDEVNKQRAANRKRRIAVYLGWFGTGIIIASAVITAVPIVMGWRSQIADAISGGQASPAAHDVPPKAKTPNH